MHVAPGEREAIHIEVRYGAAEPTVSVLNGLDYLGGGLDPGSVAEPKTTGERR